MKLEFIPLGKLSVSKANMRYAKKAPDVADILPTVRKRGVIVPVLVRPNCQEGHFEIVAGARRFHAAALVAAERFEAGDPEGEGLPCAILDDGDDAAAVEASMIENIARLDADEVSQWESFVRLVKEGQKPDEIATTFGLPELTIRRILALGNLLPRIRDLYRKEQIDRVTVRHLTMATKSQQKAWLALVEDPDGYAPVGHQLKGWLFGGQSISAAHALFDIEASGLATIADLFGEDRFFVDRDGFWAAQNAVIETRRKGYIDAGWSDAIIVPPSARFERWEHERAPKRKGGRVYIDVCATGEVTFHEGYVTRAEARRQERGEAVATGAKFARPELSGPTQTYIDLHRHAAVRAALTDHGGAALRLMVAHAIVGSPLWNVRPEPQTARNAAIAESVEVSRGEAVFDEKRRAILALLGFASEQATVTQGHGDQSLTGVFRRLLDLPDADVLAVVAIVMGETLAAGSAAVEAVGLHIGIDMADWWNADDAFFEGLRDKQVLGALVAEVAGSTVADANAKEKGATLKRIVRDHLTGAEGRIKVERWVPRWMAFPPSAYTTRGGVGTVAACAEAEREAENEVADEQSDEMAEIAESDVSLAA